MWVVEVSWGDAEAFHHRALPGDGRRTAWLHRVPGPVLVLGSAQPADHIDIAAAERDGLEICRRRSGGGAVLIRPDDCWIDLVIPPSDPLWEDDVGKAFRWVGELWADVLASLGVEQLEVHHGPPLGRELGRVVCFAGLGEGEVTNPGSDGRRRKVVGISQRRTRDGARFQALVPHGPDLSELQRYLAVESIDVSECLVGAGLDPSLITDAFLTRLARF